MNLLAKNMCSLVIGGPSWLLSLKMGFAFTVACVVVHIEAYRHLSCSSVSYGGNLYML